MGEGPRGLAHAKTEWGRSVARQRTQASVTDCGVWVAVERFDQSILVLEACPVGRALSCPEDSTGSSKRSSVVAKSQLEARVPVLVLPLSSCGKC